MSFNQRYSCDCKSGKRTLVLFSKNFAEKFPELITFGFKKDWLYLADFGIVQIEIGPGSNWQSVIEVINFVRTVITDHNRVDEIRAAWLNSRQTLAQQLVEIIYEAEPLLNFAPDSNSSELLDILQSRRIETWFQPVIEARFGQIWGYECLMRGRKNDGSLVGALQLLEWARTENLTFMLDRVCRETHLENAGQLNFGKNCRFLINFLPTAIYQPEFCLKSSLAAAARSGLEPGQVIFEVIESEKITDHDHLRNILEFYRRAGFGVALDDLGSGYAGLTLLGALQPDLIKIDRAIVAQSVSSKVHRDICASLIKLGKDNNQIVLAEGVETETEKMLMNSLGVDLFQGYLFGKPSPVPAKQFEIKSNLNQQNYQTI